MPSGSPLTLNTLRKALQKKVDELHDILYLSENLLSSFPSKFFRVCIFGSSRIKKDDPDYRFVERLSYTLASRNMDIVTGGGPGLMEAANKGAQRGRKKAKTKIMSIGLPIELPFFEPINTHLDIKRQHHRFSSRLEDFMRLSQAIIVTPGGIGTLLELFFCLQLLQVHYLKGKPVILVNTHYWQGFVQWLNSTPLRRNLISPEDISFLHLANTIEEILPILEEARRHFLHENHRAGN